MIPLVAFWINWTLSVVNFQKTVDKFRHKLKPKVLLRFAPGSMRKEDAGSRLTPESALAH